MGFRHDRRSSAVAEGGSITTLPDDLARIRAHAAMPDIPSLTPPPEYELPFHAFDRTTLAMLNRHWEADVWPVPFEVLNDVRERCERINASPGQS